MAAAKHCLALNKQITASWESSPFHVKIIVDRDGSLEIQLTVSSGQSIILSILTIHVKNRAEKFIIPLRSISVAIAPDSAFGGHGLKWQRGDPEKGIGSAILFPELRAFSEFWFKGLTVKFL